MTELAFLVGAGAAALVVGLVIGLQLASRIARLTDRDEESHGSR